MATCVSDVAGHFLVHWLAGQVSLKPNFTEFFVLKNLASFANSAWYWAGLVVLGISMEALALVYQYAWDELPCVLCIHVRIWVLAFILVALFALFVRRHWLLQTTAHVFTTAIMVGLLERSWMLLGIERGTVEGSCNFDSGLPAWFALDHWFPLMFKIWEACGYTPVLLFGITMAEALVVMSAGLVLMSGSLTVAALLGRCRV